MKKLLIVTLTAFSILQMSACTNKKTTKQNVERNTISVVDSELENQITSIAEYLNSATFAVLNYTTTDSSNASSLGSGSIYKKIINDNNSYTYYLVTNRHVVEDGAKFKVYSYEGTTIEANVLGYSNSYDVAVLTFTTYEIYNVVPFADIENVKQGQYCFAMGTPLKTMYVNTFTKGNVSAIRSQYIQHTADINAGNSGGPLVNLNGELIGINVSKLSTNSLTEPDIDGMCMAIRCDLVEDAINEIEGKNEAVINPLLGMSVTDVANVLTFNYDTFELFWKALKDEFVEYYTARGYDAEYINQKFDDIYLSQKTDYENKYNDLHAFNIYIADGIDSGMIVREVTTNSVTDLAGIKVGDIITSINNKTITNSTEFSKEFFKCNAGDKLTLGVNRKGTILTIEITL